MAYTLTVTNCPDPALATTNLLYVAPGDPTAALPFLQLGDFVYSVSTDERIAPGAIGMNTYHRQNLMVSTGDKIAALQFLPPSSNFDIALLNADISFVTARALPEPIELNAQELSSHLQARFAGQVLTAGQQVPFEYVGKKYVLRVNSIIVADPALEQLDVHRGLLTPDSAYVFEAKRGGGLKIVGQRSVAAPQLFKHKEFNFEKLGIGGLDDQFEQIFRRAFASRVFPPSVVERLGIRHVRGVLLYGPPGTGKTLIARQIGKMLNGKEPKIVNGPEVLNKYVGASEENIRNLFADAESDYKRMGEESDLHVIIFDEIDAICKSRGSVKDGSGVHDTIVNQLLTKIDGVDALNNILLIGMTNRKDMLDEALLRPGRLEVQVEIGLPDERGRVQILQIHTSKMAANSFLDADVDLAELAARTKNFSGAEIEGLVKSATSFALNRQVDVSMVDFAAALQEVKPAFGAVIESLESYRLQGMIDYGPRYQHLLSSCRTLVQQVQSSENTPLVTCLLEGPGGTGKTALAATLAIESGFPFVKIVSAESMVGYSEQSKSSQIAKVFDDAYKSPLSVIVLDDIERLLEYVAIGPRFSNAVLQTLLVLLKKQPPAGRKLFVVGTSSLGLVMQDMELASAFNVALHVPRLTQPEQRSVLQQLGAFAGPDLDIAVAELPDLEVPIKRLLLLLDLARQGQAEDERATSLARWSQVLRDLAVT
ncbi:Vesicle-fusing ATPase [Chlorella vulgaris]